MDEMKVLLDDLNPKQQEAVLATEGPVLILAGPGSGKTKTLTHRIAYLLARGIAAENILAVTFTNKAADEMKMRISALVAQKFDHIDEGGEVGENDQFYQAKRFTTFTKRGDVSVLPFIGTFHALAVRMLRAHATKIGFTPRFTIFDDDDSLSLLKSVMKERAINIKQFPAGVVSSTISRLKSELVTPEQYAEEAGIGDFFPKIIHQVYAEYQKRLKEINAMDFDDLIMQTCVLLQNHEGVRTAYQNRFHYIHVDEYQDVNQAQYVFMTLLAEGRRNIAVVGDDAQAIYGFRGADYRNIFNFEKEWPDAKVVVLDQNYRSTQVVLDAARAVIKKNTAQKEKKLWTENGEGTPITLAVVENERAEAAFVVSRIQECARNKLALKNIAVLYRTNAQSRALEEVLLDEAIPYKIVGGVRFYQRKEIKDILAYIRYILNPKDLVSLKRIINVPARGIGDQTLLGYLANTSTTRRTEKAKEALARFTRLIEELKKEVLVRPPVLFLKHLIKEIRYKEYLDDLSQNAEERWENVQELVTLAKKYDTEDMPHGLEQMLEDAALVTELETTDEVPQDAVTLMTLHAAKGLEFSTVFLVGLEEGIFPHARSLFNPTELEEERRLCYVGLTRAKEKVFLTCAMQRAHFGSTQANPPSRFLSEIPQHLIEVDEEAIGKIDIE